MPYCSPISTTRLRWASTIGLAVVALVAVWSGRLPAADPSYAQDERNYAVFNSMLVTGASAGAPGGNASAPEVIVDAAAPIYIVEGCAGDSEGHEPFTRAQPAYSAFRSNTFGYSRMTVYNASHLLWEQIQTDNEPAYVKTTGTVIDAMLLVQPTHGPFA